MMNKLTNSISFEGYLVIKSISIVCVSQLFNGGVLLELFYSQKILAMPQDSTSSDVKAKKKSSNRNKSEAHLDEPNYKPTIIFLKFKDCFGST
ncbi:unnamed protein product [Orchesella dallaii]|uniref:Uncharacterized protein n=1 Tax=Orchesella dallaii TaxID=48710 RepID=A0ABP1S885_9HEXA